MPLQLLDCSLQAQFYHLRPVDVPASHKGPTVGALPRECVPDILYLLRPWSRPASMQSCIAM
jgi:hypothetical protein